MSTRTPDERATWEQALDVLVDGLPHRDDGPDEERVWWMLVVRFETSHAWAREAHARYDEVVDTLVDHVLSGNGDTADQRAYEAQRLSALVHGATRQICAGRIGRSDGVHLVRRHARGLRRSDAPGGAPSSGEHGVPPTAARSGVLP